MGDHNYTMTVINRCGAGACRCCHRQVAKLYTVELTSDSVSKRVAVCPSCARKIYDDIEKSAAQVASRILCKVQTPV